MTTIKNAPPGGESGQGAKANYLTETHCTTPVQKMNSTSKLYPCYSSVNSKTPSHLKSLNDLVFDATLPSVGAKIAAEALTPFQAKAKTNEEAFKSLYHALVQDHDDDNKARHEIEALYNGFGVAYLAFTSASHQQDKKGVIANRWKVILPLSCQVDYERYEMLSAGLTLINNTDKAQARKAQVFFAPNKSNDEAPYDYINQTEQPFIDPYDDSHPLVKACLEAYEAQKVEETKLATPKPRTGLTAADGGIIDKVNQQYILTDELRERGYIKCPNGYLFPESTTGSAGVKISIGVDGVERCYSHHGTSDPLSNLNNGGHALDVFDVICILHYGGDVKRAVAELANQVDPEGQKARQREYMQEQSRAATIEAIEELTGLDDTGVPIHPLAKVIDLSDQPEPPKWVVPNFIAEGLVMLAGGHGVGKTTVLLPLAMAVAGVHDREYQLAPKHWRHVIYITEDVSQAQRIITGHGEDLDFSNPAIFMNIKERVHIVEAYRMGTDRLVQAGKHYIENYTRTIISTGADGKEYTTELLPLVVIDTMAATIELENENDNSEASNAVAALKQRFEGLPTWIVSHVAKADLNRTDAVTLRGAGAFEADANQVLYLIKDNNGKRWIIRGKTRFESPYQELEIKSSSRDITVKNRFGDEETITLRWSVPHPLEGSRKEVEEKATEERKMRDAEELRERILLNVTEAYKKGLPLNKSGVKKVIGGNGTDATNTINALIADGWLLEVEVPKSIRLQNKASFLVAFDEVERVEFLSSGKVPESKQYIPPSWKKTEEGS